MHQSIDLSSDENSFYAILVQFVPWSESCAAVAGEKCVMMQWTAIELQQNEFRNLITGENRPHSPHDKIHPVPNHNKNISVT